MCIRDRVNKRSDMRTPAVFIIGHCVMGRIKEQFCDVKVRKKAFHPEKAMQKPCLLYTSSIIRRIC